MSRSVPVHAEHTLEIEVTLTGMYAPYVPATGPTYSSGGDPPDGGFTEDVEIEGARIERIDSKWDAKANVLVRTPRRFDLFAGVDRNEPNVSRLIANILEAIEDEAQEALNDAATRYE
jgi:hypothetical protein